MKDRYHHVKFFDIFGEIRLGNNLDAGKDAFGTGHHPLETRTNPEDLVRYWRQSFLLPKMLNDRE